MQTILKQWAAGFGSTIVLIAAALVFGGIPAQAQGTTVNAQYVGTSVPVDGNLGAVWANATPVPLVYKYAASGYAAPTGACSSNPTMRALWDGNMLYVMISASKSYVSGGSAFGGDRAEFWVDDFNDKVQKFEEDDGTFVISAPNSSTGATGTSSNGTNAGDQIYPNLANRYLSPTTYKSVLVKNGSAVLGYNVEFAWPIGDHVSAIGNHASLNGANFGFDVTTYEVGGSSGSTVTCRWMLSPATADRTTNNNQPWGTIALTGYNPSTSAPMQLDTLLLGVNIGAAKTATQVFGNTAIPAITNKATWAQGYSSMYTSTNQLSSDLAAAQQAMSSTSQSTIDFVDAALDADLHNLRRNGPYPYGGGPYPDPHDLPNINYLPDPFQFLDGSRVVSLADWSRRRQEIMNLAQYYEYGWYPPPSAYSLSATSSGTGTTKTISITIVANGHTFTASAAKLTLPSVTPGAVVNGKSAPWPVIVSIDLAGTPGSAPASYINAGYAVLDIGYTQWANDGPTPSGALNTLWGFDPTTGHDFGSLMGWAWGASRAVDSVQYLINHNTTGFTLVQNGQTVPLVDMNKLAVIGFSRCGKATLAAGFFDSRFKVTAPGGSGDGGMQPYRYASDNNYPFAPKSQFGHVYWWEVPPYTSPAQSNGGEAMGDHIRHNTWNTNILSRSFLNDNEPQPNTFQPRMYRQYSWGYGTKLPYDHHEVIAAIAPRAVLTDESSDDYADEAEGDAVGYEGALPVYKYLGAQQYLAIDTVMETNNPAYHSLKTTQATNFIRFLDFVLYGIPLPNTIPTGDSSYVISGSDLPTNVQLYTDHYLTGAVDHSSIYDYYYGGFSTIMPWLSEVPHANLLTSLTTSTGTLSPAFSETTNDYTVTLPYGVSSVNVSAVSEDPKATISINGATTAAGSSSQTIAETPGTSTIPIEVTAVDSAVNTYNLVVTETGAATATAVSSSNPSVNVGATVTFTATVTATQGTAPPTGTVVFLGGATVLGTGTLNVTGPTTSTVTYSTSSLAVGTHNITAAFQGNSAFVASTSTPISQAVLVAPTITITATATLSKVTGGYQATVTVKNTGTSPASNVVLSGATLGTTSGTPLPQTWGTLAGGAAVTFTVAFPGSAGADGAGVAEKLSGTYTGGSFAASIRSVTLP
jgi:hypothetical protein